MLFKTPLGVEGTFNLYKRDTSFLDLSGKAGLLYTLNGFNTIGIFYKFVNSQPLSNSSNINTLDISPVLRVDLFLLPHRDYKYVFLLSYYREINTIRDTRTDAIDM